MQERKVVVSRTIKSARLFPQVKETPEERIARFVNAQKQVVAYPFSPDISVKALGRGSSDPSSDNKAKRNKAKSKFMRVGTGIFDPEAKAKPGQYFEIRPRKINQDGQMGDVANVGWLYPREKVSPKNIVPVAKQVLAEQDKKVSVRVVPAQKNKRTGQIEAKALGRTIGQTLGNVGQAAARAVGIVVDPDGRFRCPPGVPAANQFTDEVGSNCFDFSPLVAQALVRIAQRFGQRLQTSVNAINTASPFARDSDGNLVPKDSLRSADRLRGRALDFTPPSERVRPSILGPDGKPISTEMLEMEEAAAAERAVADELARAERELRDISKGTGEVIDPETYEDEFRKALRAAYPGLSDVEIDDLAKIAASRERMKDEMRKQQREAMEIIRSMGIDVDESDPNSVQKAIADALLQMRKDGWNVDLSGYYGDAIHDNPAMAMLQHQRRLSSLAVLGITNAIRKGTIHGITDDDLKKIAQKYGEDVYERMIIGVQQGLLPSDMFPDDEKAQDLMAMAKLAYLKAQSYEVGTMMQLIRQRKNSPELMDDIRSINMVKPNPADPFFAECAINPSNGYIEVNIDVAGMLMLEPPRTLVDSGFHLYEPNGTAGTEIAKLQAIGEAVSAENRRRLLGSYMEDLVSYRQSVDAMKIGQGYQTEILSNHFGGMAHGQFVMSHELIHGRQLKLVAEFVKTRNPGMTNLEALDWARRICIEGEKYLDASGQEFDYSDIISNPQIFKNAITNLGEIISVLIDNRVGGSYGPSHYYKAFYMNQIANANSIDEMVEIYENAAARFDEMKVERDGSDTELNGLDMALKESYKIISEARANGFDEIEEMRKGVQRWAGITFLEMQADIAAGVEMGLIEKTPEIEAFLAPLEVGRDMDKIRETIMPPVAPIVETETRIQKLTRIGKRISKIRRADFAKIIEDSDRIAGLTERDGEHDSKLMSTALKSTAAFEGRGAASRWGKSVRDIAMESATPKQRQVVEGKWRNRRWNKSNSEMSLLNALALGEGDSVVREIEDEFIPFVDLIDNSSLPNGVAAEIVMPGGLLGLPGQSVRGNRLEIGDHFTGILKSTDDLATIQVQEFPLSNQRVIVNIPEGFKGLPDYTPGTDKSEVGSIILPPGEIEVIGMRDDGVAMARLVSQRSPSDILAKKRGELSRAEERAEDVGDKITLRKAINRIERREQEQSRRALRSAGTGSIAQPRPNTQVPSEPDSRSTQILDRMESQGITWGKPIRARLNELRDQLKAKRDSSRGIVSAETHDFESPEEAKVRVDRSIDNAMAQIKSGTLPGLSPEVAEIMKEKSPEEMRQILVDTLKKQVEGLDKRARFRIRGSASPGIRDAQDSPLMGFIKTGRWRTTHDPSGSAVSSDSEKRKMSELLLGIPESADDSLRPAHGFYLHVDELEFQARNIQRRKKLMEEGGFSPGEMAMFNGDVLANQPGTQILHEGKPVDPIPYQYGLSEIVLRPETSQRTVITFGDSLNGLRTPIPLDGSATDDELLEAGLLQRSTALDSGMFGGPIIDTTQNRIAALLEASVSQNHAHVTAHEGQGSKGRYYTEAIVGGGFSMDDVEEIRIEPDFESRYMMQSDMKPGDVDAVGARQLLSGVMPDKDIQAVERLLSDVQQDDKKSVIKLVRDLVADRTNLSTKLKERNRVRSEIESRVSDPSGKKPKVTFLDSQGRDFEKHSSYPATMQETGMTEEHDISDLVKRGAAARIRKAMKDAGMSVSSDEEFDATKPQPRQSLRSAGPARSLRSSGTLVIDSPDAVEPIGNSGISRRLARRTSGEARTTQDKMTQGPSSLAFGYDKNNVPTVATVEQLEARFGSTPKDHKEYFKNEYGVTLKGKIPEDKIEKEAYYGSLQALDDLLSSIDASDLLKRENLRIYLNDTAASPDQYGEFSQNRRILVNYGREKLQIRIFPESIKRSAETVANEYENGRIFEGLEKAYGWSLVSNMFDRLTVKDIDKNELVSEVSRRSAYAFAVHEFGHLMDYLARDGSDKRVQKRTMLGAAIFGYEPIDVLERRSHMSQQTREEMDKLPSVSRYGLESPAEKLAEAWTAWWLFARRPDIQIRPSAVNQGPNRWSGQPGFAENIEQQPIADVAGQIIKPLLEKLGESVKSAEGAEESIPPIVALYSVLPFIINEEAQA